MTTYPDFIENELENYFRERGQRRWDCFEQEGYRSLICILNNTKRNPHNTTEETFMYYPDFYILLMYITNGQHDFNAIDAHDNRLAEAISDNKNNTELNWSAIYDYIENTEDRKMHNVFEQFKDELNNQDTFCLY